MNIKITKESFLNWYFMSGSDDEQKEIRNDLANAVIDGLIKNNGIVTINVQQLFDQTEVGIIPLNICYDVEADDMRTIGELKLPCTVQLM